MIPRRTNSVSEEIMTMPERCATIVANMSISYMIIPNPQSSTRSKMMMKIKTNTQRKVMRRRTSRRKGHSREKKISRLFFENGSPMGNPQMKIQVMMNPRRR